MKFIAIGDTGIDYYSNRNIIKPGGIAFNIAVNILSQGENVSLITTIGNDILGKRLGKLLKTLTINSSHIKFLKGKTPKQNIFIKNNGERKFIGYSPGVLKKWKLNNNDVTFITNHDVIFVPLADGIEHIFHSIKDISTNALKVVDFSQDYEFADFDKENNLIKKYSKYFDFIFVGGKLSHTKMIKEISNLYPQKLFILTLGKAGSMVFYNHQCYAIKSKKKVTVVDTTGAGDAFQATFLIYYLKSKNIVSSLKKASEAAEAVLKHIGSTKFDV